MNKTELIDFIAEQADLSKNDAANAINAFTEAITTTLADKGTVSLVGFGSFSVTERAARDGRNPRTGDTIKIAASTQPKFKAGKALRDAVN